MPSAIRLDPRGPAVTVTDGSNRLSLASLSLTSPSPPPRLRLTRLILLTAAARRDLHPRQRIVHHLRLLAGNLLRVLRHQLPRPLLHFHRSLCKVQDPAPRPGAASPPRRPAGPVSLPLTAAPPVIVEWTPLSHSSPQRLLIATTTIGPHPPVPRHQHSSLRKDLGLCSDPVLHLKSEV